MFISTCKINRNYKVKAISFLIVLITFILTSCKDQPIPVVQKQVLNNNLEILGKRFVFKNKDTLSFDNFKKFSEINGVNGEFLDFKVLDDVECKKYTDKFLPMEIVKDRLYIAYFYSFQPVAFDYQPVVFYSVMDDIETLHLVTLDSSAQLVDNYQIGVNQSYPDLDKAGKQFVYDKSAMIFKISSNKYKIEQYFKKNYNLNDNKFKTYCDTAVSYVEIQTNGKILRKTML